MLPSLCLVPALFAQDAPTFKTRVALVHIDAEVVEEGRTLNGFTADDFRILDQGKPQRLLHLSRGEDPLDIILLFDVSGSMKPKVQQVADAAREGMQELRPGDRVAVMTFNTRTRLVLPFTEDLEQVQRTIREEILALPFGGGTFIQSAVSDAAKRFMRERRGERRRAVLIVTDDIGQRTRRESTVVRELWEADAVLTGLIVGGRAFQIGMVASPYMMALKVGVKGIAQKTGGDFIVSGDPAADFPAAMRRIRNRYHLFYAMPEGKPGVRRSIRVELTAAAARSHPKAKVRARTGYVMPADPDR
jgi:VWFA-related protein